MRNTPCTSESLRGLIRGLFLLGLFAGGLAPAASAAADPIPLRDLPLLFADDSGVASRDSLVREFHPAKTRSEPVVVPDQPWEFQRVYMWGSAYYDAPKKQFQLWYMARLPLPSMETRMLYATSIDGLKWTKPALGLFDFNGSKANNMFDGEAGSAAVLVDHFDPDPARRYKMLSAHHGGYFASYSPDGFHWSKEPKNPVQKGDDTVTLTQHPFTGEYLAFHKLPKTVGAFQIRSVWLSRSRDFVSWSTPVLVFAPDAGDDDWVMQPEERTEVYDMPVFPHAAGFIGLPAMFRNKPQTLTPELKAAGAVAPDGPIDIQLTTSADGVTWRRSWPRLAIIPRGAPGTFDAGAILGTACAPVDYGDETWIYYTAISATHGKAVPPKRITVGRAEWRLHGFASLDAGPTGGTIVTRPLRLAGPNLLVNADASRGELQVALQEMDGRPIDGFGFADSTPLRADATKWVARWTKPLPLPTDRAVQVSLRLKDTRLYSLSSGTGR